MAEDIFFPIDIIEKNSKVVIYGAGKNGKKYYDMNKILNWCDIVLVADLNYENVKDFPAVVVNPVEINDYQYDYVMVSVYSYEAKCKIKDYLIHLGVPKEKIILNPERFLRRENEILDYIPKDDESNRKLQICFYPGGVMGDNVITLRLYKEIVRLAPNSEIDVMTGFKGFPEVIYGKQKNFRRIVQRWISEKDRDDYDLIIQSHFEPSLLYYNVADVSRLEPQLAEAMNKLYEYQKTDFFYCTPAQYMNRIQWDRAKFLEKNCYTILDSSNAFGIKDKEIDFEVDENYKKEFDDLGLNKKYITFNFGASDPLKNGKQQTKMWLYDYHCALNKLIKKEYPEIEIVQIGASDVTTIPGADRYVLGPHLEVTKHVLKNSFLHIDCEGGLVHIASQLGTKCVVLFGPTPIGFFGYENNINIVGSGCKECCGLVPDWYTRCYKYDSPRCMSDITPEMVMCEIRKVIR